ncbi:hypothetical protein ACEZDB_22495 [Streptacidiphilus sp. N1-3]|uniref:Ig-like domain-containing protein n=1 Tax=Streptacidiphilus alkalitolerans TaxID=3342712 RepID=A0ABV6X586_9ACTN
MTPEDTPRDAVPPDSGTFRLRPPQRHAAPPPPPDTSTVQLGGGYGAGPGTGYGTPMPAYEATPTVFSPPAPPPDEQPPAESLIRFGPGVPDPKTARTMAVWQGAGPAGAAAAAEQGKPKKRKLGGFLLAGLVLLGVVAFLLWNRFGTPLSIGSVAVTASPAALTCDGTEEVNAVVHTNGGSGVIHYRWIRSDGSSDGMQTKTVPSGLHEVTLPLRWTVQGNGNLQATATVEITEPGAHSASASFNYSCSK